MLKQPWAYHGQTVLTGASQAANTAVLDGAASLFVLQWLYANSTRQMVDWGSIHNHVWTAAIVTL